MFSRDTTYNKYYWSRRSMAASTAVKRGVADLVIEPRIHVSGLGANLHELTKEQLALINELRANTETTSLAQVNADYLCDAVFVKFLIARDWDVKKATKMLTSALTWRTKRPSHRYNISMDPEREQSFRLSGNSGKIRVTGVDKHGE